MPLASGQLLKYNGTKWTNELGALNELSDVTITTPSNNQVIKYNGSNWINGVVTGGGISYLGTWNAATNTPTITSGTGTAGQYYIVTVSGTTTVDGLSYWRSTDWIIFNGTTWSRIITASDKTNTYIPDVFYTGYNFEAVKRYIEDLSVNGSKQEVTVNSYTVPAYTLVGCIGAIQSLQTNSIIFVGNLRAHMFLTPSTNTTSQSNNVNNKSCNDIVYHPLLKRYYIVLSENPGVWYYYTSKDTIATYTSPTTVTNPYYGGAYSPTQQRLYFAPYGQANQTSWHYIDSTGTVVTYTPGATAVIGAYNGGVYSPTQNRIYFIPNDQANQTQWHYVDCSNGNIVAYTHGATVLSQGYIGGVYSPTQNRIYFVPYLQANQTQWHYIDCSNGNIVAYNHGVTAVSGAYFLGAYAPTQNRIYLTPYNQANQTTWHYIDCNNGNVVPYIHGVTAVVGGYAGAAYSAQTDRVYFAPYNQLTSTTWHYIECNTDKKVPSYIPTAILR